MDVNKLSDILHCCGLDAFTRPSSQSAKEWKNYRDKISSALLHQCDIQEKPAKPTVLLLTSQDGDWEGLFIDGELIDQGHQLGEGRKEHFWLNIGSKYGITGDDLIVKEVVDLDDEYLGDHGEFPDNLGLLYGNYTNG